MLAEKDGVSFNGLSVNQSWSFRSNSLLGRFWMIFGYFGVPTVVPMTPEEMPTYSYMYMHTYLHTFVHAYLHAPSWLRTSSMWKSRGLCNSGRVRGSGVSLMVQQSHTWCQLHDM